MKRFVSFAALALSLVMVLSLAACGGDKPAQEQGGDTPSTTTETKKVDLAAVRTQIIDECQIAGSGNVETDGLSRQYGISADQVASSASFSAPSNGAFPQEIVMVEAKDEAAAADIKAKLDSRLKNIADQAASYDPDSLALAEKCQVVSDGVYVGMFFSAQYDTMVSIFQKALA